jgi:hypothetical protein
MKIATGIIAMLLGLIVLLQSCTVGTASHLVGNQASSDAGAAGIGAGFLIFVGGAFAFALPLVSVFVFAAAGLLALTGAADFPDLQIWAIISGILAGMAVIGWSSDRKKKRVPAPVAIVEHGE